MTIRFRNFREYFLGSGFFPRFTPSVRQGAGSSLPETPSAWADLMAFGTQPGSFYRFDEAGGGTVTDHGSNGYDLTLSGGTQNHTSSALTNKKTLYLTGTDYADGGAIFDHASTSTAFQAVFTSSGAFAGMLSRRLAAASHGYHMTSTAVALQWNAGNTNGAVSLTKPGSAEVVTCAVFGYDHTAQTVQFKMRYSGADYAGSSGRNLTGSATSTFRLGANAFLSSMDLEWDYLAVWQGSAAESVLASGATYNQNVLVGLGYE